MTATVRVPWRNGFVDAGNPDPIATASFSFTERTAHRAGGGCDRVLIGRILNRRLHVTIPPPVSVQMARDIGGYQSGLTLFHLDLIEPWVAWFADAIAAPATRTTEVLDDVAVVQDGWRIRTAYLNIDAGVRHLCELLLRAPVLKAELVATMLGITEQAARIALIQLVSRLRGQLRPSVVLRSSLGRTLRSADAERARGCPGRQFSGAKAH